MLLYLKPLPPPTIQSDVLFLLVGNKQEIDKWQIERRRRKYANNGNI